MDALIANECLCVRISALGAEMQSIRDRDGTEFLWGGNPAYWQGRAPTLFPYIARLTEQTYTLNSRPYRMGIHGFAAQSRFMLESQTEDTAVFLLCDNAKTRAMYPFRFAFRVSYSLEGERMSVGYTVCNTGEEPMYFGVGGHPGFALPFEAGLAFEDYFLEFDEAAAPVRIGFSEACFVTGDDAAFPLDGGTRLRLAHRLFDRDAIVLKNAAKGVTLKSARGAKAIRVQYPDMRYIGFWHAPRTDAPYVCIEPWTSLPSRQGVVEELTRQKDLVMLPRGETYRNVWVIERITAEE